MNGLFDGYRSFPGLLAEPDPPAVAPPHLRPVAVPSGAPVPAVPPQSRLQQILSFVNRGAGAIGDGLTQAATGPSDPRLSAEQNRKAQSQAMINAGLAMMAAPGEGFAGVAQGLLTGQQMAAGTREQMYATTQQERIQQALQDPALLARLTPEQQQMLRFLPPMEAMKVIVDALSPKDPILVGDGAIAIDPVTRKPVFENTKDAELSSFMKDAYHVLGIDPATATPEQRASARAVAAEMRKSGSPTVNINNTPAQRDFGNINELGSAFQKEIGDHITVANSYGAVISAANDPSAAGDLSMIFAYMKILDPGSVVRESEFATAQNAANVPERIRAAYNRALKDGTRLTPEMRADFIATARRIAQQRQRQLNPILNRYRRRASGVGLDPSLVVFDPFEEAGLSDEPRGKDRLR